MKHHRLTVLAAGMVLAATTLACAPNAIQDDADSDAASVAAWIARYLRSEVLSASQPPVQQMATVRRWLADPTQDATYIRGYGAPALRILDSAADHVDIVVYASSRGTMFDGPGSADGYSCARYTITNGQLDYNEIHCPKGLSRNPNAPAQS